MEQLLNSFLMPSVYPWAILCPRPSLSHSHDLGQSPNHSLSHSHELDQNLAPSLSHSHDLGQKLVLSLSHSHVLGQKLALSHQTLKNLLLEVHF